MAQKQISELITKQVADNAALASGAGFMITLADIDHMVSIAAGLAAVVSACAAAYYYVTKARREKNGNGTEPNNS